MIVSASYGRHYAEAPNDARAWVADRDPKIAALEPTVFLRDGVVSVRVTAVGPTQAAASSRFSRDPAKRG